MSIKVYDKTQSKWVSFAGTQGPPGKDAYIIAQENGYKGTKEEYSKVLTSIPDIINSVDDFPTENSKNLVTSGGVWWAIRNLVGLQVEVVDELPATGNFNTLYLVKKNGTDQDGCDEFMFVNDKWERIGSTEASLADFYTKEEVDSKFSWYDV